MAMRVFPIAFLCAASLAAASAHAETDLRIEGAKQCTAQIPKYEREYGVPTHLLSAISSAETGRWHQGLKIVLPWPWTINAEGKGYYFDTKQEAIAAAKAMKARGVKSMDLGCMQVNIYHHPNAFRSIEEAFEPQNNVAYAASFLRNLYESEGSWKAAAAAYHSKTPERGAQYVSRVFDKWHTILDRLRMPNAIAASAERKNPATAAKIQAKMPVQLSRLPENSTAKMLMPNRTTLVEQKGKQLPQQKPVHMKIIEVANVSSHRENGIIVVRPDVKPDIAAQAAPIQMAASNARIVSLSPSAGTSTKPAGGPRFIFND